jgi:hypothetical protein
MTNLLETTKTTAQRALCLLLNLGGGQPGEAHLAGSAGARGSTIDEDLDVLLHEIQRRRSGA